MGALTGSATLLLEMLFREAPTDWARARVYGCSLEVYTIHINKGPLSKSFKKLMYIIQ